jgi:hypothetical protein
MRFEERRPWLFTHASPRAHPMNFDAIIVERWPGRLLRGAGLAQQDAPSQSSNVARSHAERSAVSSCPR